MAKLGHSLTCERDLHAGIGGLHDGGNAGRAFSRRLRAVCEACVYCGSFRFPVRTSGWDTVEGVYCEHAMDGRIASPRQWDR